VETKEQITSSSKIFHQRVLTKSPANDTIFFKMKIAIDTGEVYDVQEAAKLIGIGYATVYRWIKSGKIIAVRLAGRTLIPKSEVERLRRLK